MFKTKIPYGTQYDLINNYFNIMFVYISKTKNIRNLSYQSNSNKFKMNITQKYYMCVFYLFIYLF